MNRPLSDFERVVLAAMPQNGGYCTSALASLIGRQPGYESNRQHSALIGATCRVLERLGLIRQLDGQKPACWCKA